ncbi:MAG: choice-of-anchor D domain-containing protein [Terriglobales bacterium]
MRRNEKARIWGARWKGLVVFLALTVLAGCQGLSAGSKAQDPPPQQNNANGSLGINTLSLDFGSVPVASNKTVTATATNNGSTDITVSSVTFSAPQFTLTEPTIPLTVAAGKSASLSVMFVPTATGSFTGSMTITSDASDSPAAVAVQGTGVAAGQLSVSPASLNFGSVPTGSNQTLPATLTNVGNSSTIISQATVTGAGLTLSGLSLPLTLAVGQSTTFNVVFAPQASGTVNGSVAIVSDAINSPSSLPLTGDGLAPGSLSANPPSINFPNVVVGGNQSVSETLTNSSGSSVTITQAAPTGAGFSISGLNLPLTLPGNQSTTFDVVFTPESAGSVSGNLTISSDAANPTLNIPLSGTAVMPGTLTPTKASINFGNVQVGSNKTITETVTNTGGVDVNISQAKPTGTGFSINGITPPLTLTPGQSITFNVVFTPPSPGSDSGNVAIKSDASNPTLNIPLSGAGVAPGTLTPTQANINFGNVQVGHNKSVSETVTNTGGSNVNISQATASGTGFSISGINPPLTLTPGQSVTFNVVFTPPSPANDSGNVAIKSDASNPTLNIPLSGVGTPAGQLAVNPTSLNFGNVVVGNSSQKTAQLQATGATVIVSSVNVSDPQFTVSGLAFPLTLSAGQNAQFTVTFTPQSTGAKSATVSFTSDASNSPAVLSVSGTGTQAAQHSVLLNWTASISPNITGYNVYRSGASGGPYSKISSADPNTNYTDTTVTNGSTYYYVTTAVDSNSQESTYSNEAQAVIPGS